MSVYRVVKLLQRMIKTTANLKMVFGSRNMDFFMDYLHPGGLEDCSFLELRNICFFSLLYHTSVRFRDICGMKLGHVVDGGPPGYGVLEAEEQQV